MNKNNDDDIDLFETFEMLWNGKLYLAFFIIISAVFTFFFIIDKDIIYQSVIKVKIEKIPPAYKNKDVFYDYKKMFLRQDIFNSWKSKKPSSQLVFDQINNTFTENGITLTKETGSKLLKLNDVNNVTLDVLVSTNQIVLLDEVYRYFSYVNENLKKEYLLMSEYELKKKYESIITETLYSYDNLNTLTQENNYYNNTKSELIRYIYLLKKGYQTLDIKRPTKPKQLGTNNHLVIILSIIVGGLIGVFFLIIKNAINIRIEKKQS